MRDLPLSMLLKPWNLPEVLRPGIRALNRVTKLHHRSVDRILNSVLHKSVFHPHGFFPDGFGQYELVSRYAEQITDARRSRPPITRIGPLLGATNFNAREKISTQEGQFTSTLSGPLSDLPEESRQCYFELVRPQHWEQQQHKAAVVLLPAMGEFKYGRRHQAVALPLSKHGIATVILEGPFYGQRKPPKQMMSKLRQLTDLLVLGRATIEEARSLLLWLKEELQADTVVVAGCSMGGLHSAMTGAMTPFPVGIVAHIAPPSAHHPFCEGALFDSVDKTELSKQVDTPEESSLIQAMADYLATTEITRFPNPVRPDAAIITVGNSDEYIPSSASKVWESISENWHGCKLKELDAGHVTGIMVERDIYRQSIVEVVNRLRE